MKNESRAIWKLYYLLFFCSHTLPDKKVLKDRRFYFSAQLDNTLHRGREGTRLGASGIGHNTLQSEISEQTRIKMSWGGGREMAQQLRTLAALPGDPVMLLSTHILAHKHL